MKRNDGKYDLAAILLMLLAMVLIANAVAAVRAGK
jgi:hypothetical protein